MSIYRPVLIGLCIIQLPACNVEQASTPVESAANPVTPQTIHKTTVTFVDVAAAAGITARNVSGNANKQTILETTGAGGCFLDFDLDGDLDLYLVNGATLKTWSAGNTARNTLYRNDAGLFTDVTDTAGVGDSGWGGGCAVADYDNDGDPDIFVSNFGANALYRNERAGRFTNVAIAAGVADARWGAGAAFADINADGHLDLYVANYVEFDTSDLSANPGNCRWKGTPVICGPRGFEAQTDVLYLGAGDGAFVQTPLYEDEESTDTSRFGLGVVAGDLDDDGDADFYVANDSQANLMYLNEGHNAFQDQAMIGGSALSGDGRPQAGMGADLGDYDADGDQDIFVTNFTDDNHALYRNDGAGLFTDVSIAAGLATTRASLGWGGGFFDFDNDGQLDIYVASGHVYPQSGGAQSQSHYQQQNMLLQNQGNGRYRDVSDVSGSGFKLVQSSRGVAHGDFDNDGDIDLVIVNENDVPALLRNDGGNTAHWIKLQLFGSRSNRDGIGAKVTLTANGHRQFKELRLNSGFYSSHDPRMHFGLGDAHTVTDVLIVWPSGTRQIFTNLPSRRLVTVHEDHGILSIVSLTPLQVPVQRENHTADTAVADRFIDDIPRAANRTEAMTPEQLRNIQVLVMQATDHILGARYDAAITLYGQALAQMPDWERAVINPTLHGFDEPEHYQSFLSGVYDNLGVAYLRAEQFDRCETAITTAINIWPQRAKYHHNLGLCHFHGGRYSEAIDALLVSRKLDTDRPRIAFDLGRALVMAGRCSEAQHEFDQSTRTLPVPDPGGRRAESWYFLGLCRENARQYEAAIQAFRETLALIPGHQKALYKLANAFRSNGQTQAADAALKLFHTRQETEEALRASKLARSESTAQRMALAQAYLDGGQPQAAIREVRILLSKNPNDPNALVLFANAVMSLHPAQINMAEKVYAQVLARNAQDSNALAGLAALRLHQQNIDQAEKLYRQALESAPQDQAARLGLARVAAANGQSATAIEILMHLSDKQNNDPALLRALAQVHVAPNNADQKPALALNLLDTAASLYGEDVPTRVRALLLLNQQEKARRVIAQSPFLNAAMRESLLSGLD